MNASLLYNVKDCKWHLIDDAKNLDVYRNYDRAEVYKWATANGYSNVVRKG